MYWTRTNEVAYQVSKRSVQVFVVGVFTLVFLALAFVNTAMGNHDRALLQGVAALVLWGLYGKPLDDERSP